MGERDTDSLLGEIGSRLPRLFFESTSLLIALIGADGRIRVVNPAWERQLGWSADALVGSTTAGLLHPDDLERTRELAEGMRAPGAVVNGFENRYRDAAGDYRWISWSAVSDGEVWLATGRDVTREKEFEERAQLFVSLVELSDDFIALAGLDQRVIFVNEAGRRLVGLDSFEEARAHPIEDYLTEEGRTASLEVEQPAVIAHGRWSGESTLRHFRTGAAIDVTINSFLVTHPVSGAPVALATVQRDVTEAKRARLEAERLARDRARIALLALRRTEEDRARVAEILHDSVVQDLAFARQEVRELVAGDRDAAPRALAALERSLAAIRSSLAGLHPGAGVQRDLRAALENLGRAATEAGIVYSLVCDTTLEPDTSALVFVIVRELVRNAIAHAAASRIAVRVTMDGPDLLAEVEDDGEGIPAPRLAAALAEGHIGLAACRERALEARGTLRLLAREPTGTTAVLRIPRTAGR